MCAKIHEEISRRLGTPPEQVDAGLEAVVERIRQQIAHGGSARLKGIGTLRSRQGGIEFKPDGFLREAVNFRYAGLEDLVFEAPTAEQAAESLSIPNTTPQERPSDEPVSDAEMAEPPSPPDSASKTDEMDDFWSDLVRSGAVYPLGPTPEPPLEENDLTILGEPGESESEGEPTIAWTPPTVPQAPLVPPSPPDDAASLRPGEMREPDDVDDSRLTPGEEAAGTDDTETVQRPTAVPDRPPQAHHEAGVPPHRPLHGGEHDSAKPIRSRGPWLILGFLAVAAAAAIIYVVIPSRPPAPAPSETTQTETTGPVDEEPAAPGDAGQTAPTDTAGTASASEPIPGEGDELAEEGETPAAASDTPAGAADVPGGAASEAVENPLRSEEGIDPAQGGFTIVVVSETDLSRANEAAREYAELGFRTGVLAPEGDGAGRYRVGVGQFPTLDDAVEAHGELAGGELPGDAWVLRI